MGIYMNSISGGNTIGPLICGFIVQGLSWRWHKWIAVILTAINFIAVVLLVPETRYARDESSSGEVSSSNLASSSDEEVTLEKGASASSIKTPASPTPPEDVQVPKKTFVEELSLWSGTPKDTNLLLMFIRPFPMIVYPSVIFSFLGYAISLVIVVAVNILNSFVLQAPPYSWQPQINGLINIPGLIGNFIGAYAGGWLVDVFCDWRTKKNQGIYEPESRLWLLALPAVITTAGCILFGYGVERTLNWSSLFVGYGMISFALTAVSFVVPHTVM